MTTINILQPGETGNPHRTPVIDPSGISRKYLDLSYTPDLPHPMRRLDIYLPEGGDGPFPVLIYMHGGGFVGGLKNDAHAAGYMEALDEGFAFVGVEQRLCSPQQDGSFSPEGRFPGALYDLKAAIRYLRANAAQYKLDPDRFALLGTSAGGYHVAMAAATQDISAMYDESLGFTDVSGHVHAVVDLFGVGDLVLQSAYSDKMIADPPAGYPVFLLQNFADVFFGVPCQENTHLTYFANPETWVSPGLPPMLIQMGAADMVVPVECARRLAQRIDAVCGKGCADYDEFPDFAHGDPRFHDPANHKRIFDWLREKLGA
ncbi:MAG: alpha/beta hydrolase [Clostridiales bacterium]|nr:alpha/beta hydrolase [Clostridiales bacterium]